MRAEVVESTLLTPTVEHRSPTAPAAQQHEIRTRDGVILKNGVCMYLLSSHLTAMSTPTRAGSVKRCQIRLPPVTGSRGRQTGRHASRQADNKSSRGESRHLSINGQGPWGMSKVHAVAHETGEGTWRIRAK